MMTFLSSARFPLQVIATCLLQVIMLLLLSSSDHHGVFVVGQGCTNVCPPVNFGVVVPALCQGDLIDGDLCTGGVYSENNVKADVNRIYDVCYPTSTNQEEGGNDEEQSLSFKFNDFRGPSNTVTVIANYYTGCNAGRRESGVFAHVAQKYYDLYGPDKVHFIQSVKGGGTCKQWSSIYQKDAADLFPDSTTVVNEMPWSVDDNSYAIRDQFFTSPFGHPAYVVLDGNLKIKNKFIGPCCGYESYYDCTADIARTLDTTLSGYLDAILLRDADEVDVTAPPVAVVVSPLPEEEDDIDVDAVLNCNWSSWSPCSIRCGPIIGTQIRYTDKRCGGSTDDGIFNFPIFESRECEAENPFNCNVEDGGSPCIQEFGEQYEIREVHGDFNSPRDIKFHPTPGYHLGDSSEGRSFVHPDGGDEAWVVNGQNHSISIITAVGNQQYQSSISRRDRGYYHYMINGTAISFNKVSDSGRTNDRDTFNYWSICNNNNNNYLNTKESNYFMGPTLYDSNPENKNLVNKLGQICNQTGNEDEECYFLHSDMLHESPSCRGIVHDPELDTSYGTVYWVFDSTGNQDKGQLVRYDFQQPHGPGSMDHSIASVRRYIEIELETNDEALNQAGVHSGMVMHPTRRELYIAVPGKNHILKVDVDSGEFARTAREEYPIYSNKLPSFEYSIWECVTQDVFASNINQPTGMVFSLDYERLFVAERGTGNIIVYEVHTGDLLYTISTQFNTIGGMDISPNGNELYFVDDETNTLNVVSVVTECDITYTPRTNPEYISELEKAKVALGVNDPFKLSPNTICTVDPIVPNITFFDQVHLDGYASDDPNVQSVMAGMDAAAALLKNRTDCDYDSELNFDALLLGGYFCHTCLPNQDQICGGGGSCTNIQWEGYICDNEFQIVDNNNINTELPGTYRIQTMNGTDVDPSTLVLKPGITYRFQIDVDEEVCLSTTVLPFDRDSVKLGLSSGGVGSGSSESRNRERNSLGTNNEESLKEYVTLGCATRSGGPLFFNAGRDEITGPQIYVNTGAGTRAMILDGGVESSGHLLPGAISGLVLVVLVGLLI